MSGYTQGRRDGYAAGYEAGKQASQPEAGPECSTPRSSWGACIQALAAGWILTGDLCPECTQTFMRALGAVEPNLCWHQNYRDRAAGRVPS